jgi:hypothetical protein
LTQREHDENLMVVHAVEEFAMRHELPVAVGLALLKESGTISAIRQHFDSLHTQSLDESAQFAEDYFTRSHA